MSWLWKIEHGKFSPIPSRRCSMWAYYRLKEVCVDMHIPWVRIIDEIVVEEKKYTNQEKEEEEEEEEKRKRRLS